MFLCPGCRVRETLLFAGLKGVCHSLENVNLEYVGVTWHENASCWLSFLPSQVSSPHRCGRHVVIRPVILILIPTHPPPPPPCPPRPPPCPHPRKTRHQLHSCHGRGNHQNSGGVVSLLLLLTLIIVTEVVSSSSSSIISIISTISKTI